MSTDAVLVRATISDLADVSAQSLRPDRIGRLIGERQSCEPRNRYWMSPVGKNAPLARTGSRLLRVVQSPSNTRPVPLELL